MTDQATLNAALEQEPLGPHLSDCYRIVRIAHDMGLYINTADAERIWSEYSDVYAADWLYIDASSVMEAIELFVSRRAP